jgi:hypothetical protein
VNSLQQKIRDEINALKPNKKAVFKLDVGKITVHFSRVKKNYSISLDGHQIEEVETYEKAIESVIGFIR